MQMKVVVKVQVWLKVLWVVVTVFSVASLIWFILGSTSYFQRDLDILGTYILIQAWIPALVITVLSIVLLLKGWIPFNRVAYGGFFLGLILLSILSVLLIQSVSTQGWLNEKITSDSLKITSDNKYEYRIDLINLFQKNSHARLYLKVVDTKVEKNIPIDIQTIKIMGLENKKVNNWVMLVPTDVSSRYILYTTKELHIPEERFEIDITEGTSKKLK
jgi:hypothetical protein